jgi:hypothetical protein
MKKLLEKILGKQCYLKIATLYWKILTMLLMSNLKKTLPQNLESFQFRLRVHKLNRPPRILVRCYNGVGDILSLAAALRIFKKQHLNAWITIDTHAEGWELLNDNPYIDAITIRKPDPQEDKFDWCVNMEYRCYPNLHIIDGYLKWLGIRPSRVSPSLKKPILRISDKDKLFAQEVFKEHNID